MCYALYIGADDPLPTEKWDDEDLRFYIQDLDEKDLAVRDKFTKPNVYYAGSWQGCGCGWFADESPPTNDEERTERERTRECLRELHDLTVGELEKHEAVELFLCWEGSQGEEPKRRLGLTPEELVVDSLPMQELDFAVVSGG